MTEERDAHAGRDDQAEEPELGLLLDQLHQLETRDPAAVIREDLGWLRAHQLDAYSTLLSAADTIADDSEDYRRIAALARGLRDVLQRTEERLVHDLWSLELRRQAGQVREI